MPKRPVPRAMITTTGIEGDACAHRHIHGGPTRRILILAAEVIDDLAAQGFPVHYGALGENLTVRGVSPESLRTGQTWRAGDAILELTEIREPCQTLDIYRHTDGRWIQTEISGARAGFYAAVRRPGLVSPGAPFELMFELA